MIKENQRLLNALNVISDGVLLLFSLIAAYIVRFYIFTGDEGHTPLAYYVRCAAVILPFFLFIYAYSGLYESFRTRSSLKEFELLARSNAIGVLTVICALFVLKEIDISRWVLVFFFVIATGSIGLKRFFARKLLKAFRSNGKNLRNVLIVGSDKLAAQYANAVATERSYGYNVIGCVCSGPAPAGVKKLGEISDLDKFISGTDVDEVVAALGQDEYTRIQDIILDCEQNGVKLSLIPFYAEYMPSHPYIDEVGGIPLVNIRRIPLDNLANAFLKRAFDIVGAAVLLLLTSPIMLFAAIGTRLSSPGPVIFKQQRVGRGKKLFTMYKFRSMRVNSSSDTAWSANTDSRKTRFGSIMRKLSIDELPQLINVLKGNMSLVGPRPELPHFVEQFRHSVPLYMVKHQVRPGITGWAQVNGLRGDTSIPKRIRYDIYYIENWSLLFDLKILFATAFRAFVNSEVVVTSSKNEIEEPHSTSAKTQGEAQYAEKK